MQNPKWYGIVRTLLGIVFILAGVGKFANPVSQEALFEPYPGFFMPLVGAAELVGGLALLTNRLVRWAALGLAVIMAGAVVTQIIIGGGPRVVVPIILLVINLAIFGKAPRR